jgi:hypothetical protein
MARMSLGSPSCTGLAQAALDTMVKCDRGGTSSARLVAGHQHWCRPLIADTAVEVDCARLLTWPLADPQGARRGLLAGRQQGKVLRQRGRTVSAAEHSAMRSPQRLRLHRASTPPGRTARRQGYDLIFEGHEEPRSTAIIGRALTGIPPSSQGRTVGQERVRHGRPCGRSPARRLGHLDQAGASGLVRRIGRFAAPLP